MTAPSISPELLAQWEAEDEAFEEELRDLPEDGEIVRGWWHIEHEILEDEDA